MRFTVRHLEFFRAVAHYGSFSLAAKRLNLTQPSLSEAIKNLEILCGAKLFDRGSRSVTLTPMGEELLPMAIRVLDELERSVRDFEDYVSSRRGEIRIASIPAMFAAVLPPILASFRNRYPSIELSVRDMTSDDAIRRLRNGRLDMALVTLNEPADDLVSFPLFEHAIVLLMLPDDPLASCAPVDLDWQVALEGPIVSVSPNGQMGRLAEAVLAQHGIAVTQTQTVDNLIAALGLVKSGLSRALVSSLSAQSLVATGLKYRRLKNPVVSTAISLVTRRDHVLSPAAQSLFNLIKTTQTNIS